MSRLVQLLVLWALVCGAAGAARAAVVVDGVLNAGYPVWNRISDRPGYGDSANDNLPYEVLEIATSVPGETLTATVAAGTQFDSFLALYSTFNPAAPQSGLIAADDDGAGYPHAKLETPPLVVNTSYFLVITSYSNAANAVHPRYGSYTLNLAGGYYLVQKGTTTTVSASPNPGAVGQTVTFTASVARTSGIAVPTGTVTFRDGTVVLATEKLGPNGQASATASFAGRETRSISAVYSGEVRYTGSTSDALALALAAPPSVATGSATLISLTEATLNGTAADNGAQTSVGFDFGTSAAYGGSAAATTGGSIEAGAGSTAAALTLSDLDCSTIYHFRITALSFAGEARGEDQTFSTSPCPQTLSVGLLGTGSGSVNSDPSGIACVSGKAAGCSAVFPRDTPVTLLATPGVGSLHSLWDSCDSSVGTSCFVTLTGDRSPAATFSVQPNLRIGGSDYYGTLQTALAAVSYGQTIRGVGMLLPDTGTVTFQRPGVRAILRFGLDPDFLLPKGYTVLDGVLKLRAGTLVVDRLRVR